MKRHCLSGCYRIAVVLAAACALPAMAAQPGAGREADASYPNRPVRMLVGLPAGGSVDVVARIVSAKLGDALGQSIVVENRSGASGLIAGEIVAQAPPDGHTLLFGASFYSEVLALAQNRLPYDPLRDFAPISLVTRVANVLVVHPALPARSVSEFIAHAKAHPGKLNYASSGNGSSAHLSMEMLKQQMGIDVVHVPYKGAPQALVDLLAGDINAMFGNVPAQLPQLKTGKIRALAVTAAKRVSQLPNIPTMIEAGVPGFEITVWYGVLAPARGREPVLNRLNAELVKTLQMPEIRVRMEEQGAEPAPTTRQEFAAFQKSEVAKWTKLVKGLGVMVE